MTYYIGDKQYELVDGWAKLPQGESFVDVCGIAIDADDKVFILNRGKHHITVMNRDGNIVDSWGEGSFKRAHGSCIGPDGSIYCTDDENHTVRKFTPGGKLLMTLGTPGKPSDTGFDCPPGVSKTSRISTIVRGGPPFNLPTGVCVSATGEIYVSDGYGNARIHKFSPSGNLLFSFGDPGTGNSQFRLPHSVRLDSHSRLWVADRQNNRVQIFDKKGNYIDQWIDLNLPTDLYIDDNDTVYISELAQRISVFDINGKLLGRISSQGQDRATSLFAAPHTLAVDSRGDIYVGEVAVNYAKVDKGAKTIQKFALKR